MLAGRDFAETDAIGAPEVAIVNESFARKFFGSPSPIGRTFQVEAAIGEPRPHYQIVGIVKDTKYSDLRGQIGPIAYLSAAQEPDPWPQLQLRGCVREGRWPARVPTCVGRSPSSIQESASSSTPWIRRFGRCCCPSA